MRIDKELFLIPVGDRFLVYAPLRNVILSVGTQTARFLSEIHASGGDIHAVENDPVIRTLMQNGIIGGEPEMKPEFPGNHDYAPTRLTLFLTNTCNLACRYCYANANIRPMTMPAEIGKAAIDFVIENAQKLCRDRIEVGFHGGGEPTAAWTVFQTLVCYARTKSDNTRLKSSIGMSSNGCFGPERARWIADNLDNVSISIDGPPGIQDEQRPLLNGNPSSPLLKEGIRVLDDKGFNYSFQVTITRKHLHQILNIVEYLTSEFNPRIIKIEPVSPAGRCYEQRELVPDMMHFAEAFNHAFEVAKHKGIQLHFSGMRPLGSHVACFCGAFNEPFNITPDGLISACFETTDACAPYANTFIIGKFEEGKRTFTIDSERLELLRSRNINQLETCQDCFCKYSCGGDCATRNFRFYNDVNLTLTGARCEAIRKITLFRLQHYVDEIERRAHPRNEELVYG
ncbi:MAG TPA: SPASM domain-containing protein [Candidatus Hydrogenedentes bacterium]|nr:SPASM domain-containing protein [Candidatus Hydrogenedentota bacterium]